MKDIKTEFVAVLNQTIHQNTFVKLSLGDYKGEDYQLKNIYIKRTLIKNKEVLSFNYRYQTRDIHKNFGIEQGITKIIAYLNNGFQIATLFDIAQEYILERLKNDNWRLRIIKTDQNKEINLAHNKDKHRLINKEAGFLQKLGLADEEGNVFKQAQDKYRQINKYIEILAGLLQDLPANAIKNVVDMGSGKGYLTFALYHYLNQQQYEPDMIGVEFRQDMVDLCNRYAKELNNDGLYFEKGTIDSFQKQAIDLLIALHACDTATDDAIAKGITSKAKLIVVAPCCHKQIRREIEKTKVQNDLNFLTKHGIFLERQAEMVTDGLRTLIMEYFGYKTKAFQFVSDVHTPKNVMLVGIKSNEKTAQEQQAILQKINDAKVYFGITYHHLERTLGL